MKEQITNIVSDEALKQIQTLKKELLSCYDLPVSKAQKIAVLGIAVDSLKYKDNNGRIIISPESINARYYDLMNLIDPPLIEQTYCGPAPTES